MKDVKQIQCRAGEETVFEMRLLRSKFLVKNMTTDSISVKLGNNDTVSIIGGESWELVSNNVEDSKKSCADVTNKVTVIATEAGLVEVASIDY